mgnify:CR=1 FL=1
MSGTCVEMKKCPDCGGGSLQVFWNEDSLTFSSYCFSQCLEPKGNPYKDGEEPPEVHVKTPEEIEQELAEIKSCDYFQLKHRGIPGNVFKAWGCRLLVSTHDGKTPYAIAFPYTEAGKLSGYKVVTLKGKTMWCVGNVRDAELFGQSRALKQGGKRLYITEGEFDAIALEFIFKQSIAGTKWSHMKFAVASLPAGGGSTKKAMASNWDVLKMRFKEFVFVVDDDDVGKAAEKAFQRMYPKMLVSDKPFGCKDANDALMKGKGKEMSQMAQFGAHKPLIQGVVHVRDIIAKASIKVEEGLSFGFGEEFDRISFGQIWGEVMSTGGATGSGKTLLAHQSTAHNIFIHKEPVFNIFLEEDNDMSLRNIAGKKDGICYHNPRVEYDQDQYMARLESMDGMVLLWESDADLKLRFDLEEIVSAIRFNHAEFGTRLVNMDNMTCLVDHLGTGEANEFINKWSSELANLAAQLGLFINVFSHVNAPRFGPSHEEGAPIFPNQFTGSKGLMRACPKMAIFERNKFAEIAENKSNSYLGIVKNRKYGSEEKTKMRYDSTTGILNPFEWTSPNGTLMDEDPKQKRR